MKKSLIRRYAKKLMNEHGRPFSLEEAEGEIVHTIQRVARALAMLPTYRFGYHGVDDIEQQGVLAALEVLEEGAYDVNRPLENFLVVHIRNQLSNFKRKHYMRSEPPCKCCDPFNPPAYPCQKWLDWAARNAVKQNLMRPLDMANISDEAESNMREESVVVDSTIVGELRQILDRELSVELRKDYLQMLGGKVVPKVRRERVRQAVLAIIEERGYLDAKKTESDRG